MLKLKQQYFGHLIRTANSLESPWCWESLKKEKRVTKDEIVGWCHWCNGCELGQTPEDGRGQGGLACFNPQVHDLVTEYSWPRPLHFLFSLSGTLCSWLPCGCYLLGIQLTAWYHLLLFYHLLWPAHSKDHPLISLYLRLSYKLNLIEARIWGNPLQ